MAVSMPLSVLPGHGSSAKDCTELSLGSQGIEQLAGFETLANLEVLWLNDNKLSCLCNLDHNTRIRQLYVHNNRLSTLYGSLTKLKFLTHLDVSCNQLKGLSKVLVLKKLRYLQELTLQGNPCCEEPQYRLFVLAALPGLKVLDHHEVTLQQQQQAARLTASAETKALAVAFGTHLPQELRGAAAVGTSTTGSTGGQQQQQEQAQQHQQERSQSGGRRQQQQSVLELQLAQEVAAIKLRQHAAAAATEAALYNDNPDAAYWRPCSSLPPNPALLQAQKAWAETTTARPATGAASVAAGPVSEALQAAVSQGNNCNMLVLGAMSAADLRTAATTSSSTIAAAAGRRMSAAKQNDLAARGCLPGTFLYRPVGPATASAAASAVSDKQLLCC